MLLETIHTRRHKRLIALLVAARHKAGLRQIDLAIELKRPQSWVARIEAGGRRIDVVEFLQLATLIGFDPITMMRKLLRNDKRR
jgi:ribosome-binding protein aMBF1 (putative translation factor)